MLISNKDLQFDFDERVYPDQELIMRKDIVNLNFIELLKESDRSSVFKVAVGGKLRILKVVLFSLLQLKLVFNISSTTKIVVSLVYLHLLFVKILHTVG